MSKIYVSVPFTAEEKSRLETEAKAEGRSLAQQARRRVLAGMGVGADVGTGIVEAAGGGKGGSAPKAPHRGTSASPAP
ncbi:hypothetical protein [Roseimicrobium sp. ORNL1]|uniref:hypothetical protein n=1 Tax=Roseimicrobium sp. ORNL1 TaxID=2711231 RepID=UPI0013E19163|nr:hypothetical protein [Roseimicrobium sp. ORNL1]QIF03713.1 hypothetical protein G5S37_20040 [Roseimicrobium sp. ORNL1]